MLMVPWPPMQLGWLTGFLIRHRPVVHQRVQRCCLQVYKGPGVDIKLLHLVHAAPAHTSVCWRGIPLRIQGALMGLLLPMKLRDCMAMQVDAQPRQIPAAAYLGRACRWGAACRWADTPVHSWPPR